MTSHPDVRTLLGGLLIDLSAMHRVEIDGDSAWVGGGATVSDLLDAAADHDRLAAVGTVGSVGVVGLSLGGGYGTLNGRFGLAVDNLLAAEVVLADGSVVATDAETEPDLFWALRGGGGNFGVVTRLRTRLHPGAQVTTGRIAFPWTQARSVLGGWKDLGARADDALDVMFAVATTPNGTTLMMAPTWSGAADEGATEVSAVAGLGDPVLEQVGRMCLAAAVHAADEMFAGPSSWFLGSRILLALTETAIDAVVESADAMPGACLLNVHHAHGATTRVPIEATAYGYRGEHLVVQILGVWTDGDGSAERAWVRETEQRLDPHALPGTWAVCAAAGDERVPEAFGPNASRLASVKQRYDPGGVFSATPIPVRTSA